MNNDWKGSTLPLWAASLINHNVTPENLNEALVEFTEIIGAENISKDVAALQRHTSSIWSSHAVNPAEFPVYIVFPASTKEVSAIMKVCHRRLIPVVPYSGGTSLEGNFANTRNGICVDFSRMSSILAVNKADFDAVVQAGVPYQVLNEVLARENLFFPPDPGAGAMIGGMVGTGCSGTNSYRYGTMRNWVISLTVVLADGTIVKTRQRPVKSSAGYDLTKLFIGSEGTLCLVTEIILKVIMRPETESVAFASFPDMFKAAACVQSVVEAGIQAAAIELVDSTGMVLFNKTGATDRVWPELPAVLFKFSGSAAVVKEQVRLTVALAEEVGSVAIEFAKNEEEADKFWGARKSGLRDAMGLKKNPTDSAWVTDVAVPISKLATIMTETKEDIVESGLVSVMGGHGGEGNFHSKANDKITETLKLSQLLALLFYSQDEKPKAEAIVERMIYRAIELEGTVSGEHGIGLVKRDQLLNELGDSAVDLMRMVSIAISLIRKLYD